MVMNVLQISMCHVSTASEAIVDTAEERTRQHRVGSSSVPSRLIESCWLKVLPYVLCTLVSIWQVLDHLGNGVFP